MPTIPPPTGGDYPELPEKDWIEVKVLSIKPFDDTRFPNKDGSPKPRFEIVLEPTDPEFSASHVWVYAGRSWHEKSNLTKVAQATFPKPLAPTELYKVDTDDLIDKTLQVMGKYDPDDADRKFLKATDFKASKPAATRGASTAKAQPKAAEKAPAADDIDV